MGQGGQPGRTFVEAAARQVGAQAGSSAAAAAYAAAQPRSQRAAVAVQASLERSSPEAEALGAHLPRLVASLGPESLEALGRILGEATDGKVRTAAALGLFHHGTRAQIPALRQALSDPYFVAGPFPLYHYPVRRAAARALGRLRAPPTRQADRSYRL